MVEERRTAYRYLRVNGSAYGAGRQFAKMLKEDQLFTQSLTQPFMGQSGLEGKELEHIQEVFDKYCPGTNDEIRGFADEAGVDYEKVIYYFAYIRPTGCQCSLIAVTPELSQDGNGQMARNYEFGWDDNSMLIETAIEYQYRSIGFGCQLFGRFDGMNEHGLCVATAAGVIRPEYSEEGFVFPVIVRAILNQCRTVDEAIQLYKNIKVADYRNFMIMDAMGNAVLIEAAASQCYIRRAGKHEFDKMLYATNHYETEALKKKGYYKPEHSHIRHNAIKRRLEEEKTAVGIQISGEDIKALFSKPLPSGVCCHYYKDGMGTMWSMLFHPEQKNVEICFGSADRNSWRVFYLSDENENVMHKYEAILSNESAPEGFWNNDSQQ